MSTDTDQRLQVLEERLAFQEHTLQHLDDALASQQQQIISYQEQLRVLLQQIQKLEASMPDGAAPADERPPHY